MNAPHTLADLERLRLVLSEVHPDPSVVTLEGGHITFNRSDIDRHLIRRAQVLARVPGKCERCFELGIRFSCIDVRFPFADDCGWAP